MPTRTFYQLFADNHATALLSAGRHSGYSVVQRLRKIIGAGNHKLTVTFCGDRIRMVEYLSPEEKDFLQVSTYQKCHEVTAISNTCLRVTFYHGELLHGNPETVSMFSERLSVKAEFIITDKRGKIVQQAFPDALRHLSKRLVEKEREQAEQQRFTARQIDVLAGLKKGHYCAEQGVEHFLNERD